MNGDQGLLHDTPQWDPVAEALPHILWVARSDGYHVYFNRRWYVYTGLTQEQSVGFGWSCALHPDDKADSLARWKQSIKTGEPYEVEHRLCAADGRARWFLARGSPERDHYGAIVRWFCTGTDIDDQKKAQEELRRSQERFRLLAEAIPQKVWMADTRGAMLYLNQCWFDYTGLTCDQANGWGWLDSVHPAERQTEAARWRNAIEQGDRMEIEHRLKRGSDSAYRWHLVRGAPLRDETGAILQWVGISTDVDDQRRQAELLERLVLERTSDLERSNRRLEEFASVASHDLQEPLRKIQAFSDRLQTKCGPLLGQQGKEYLDRIATSATRMRNLIIDILLSAHVSADAQPLKPVDLAATAHEVISDLEGLIQQTDGRVLLGQLPTIHADPPQIRQLFQNLIGNGLKFQHPDRPPIVRLSARLLSDFEIKADDTNVPWYEIAIEDNGIGFEEIYLDRIFQMFQRLHGRREYEGTGMGLAICRSIVERHHGRITARSRPGQGTTILVILPAQPREEELSSHDGSTKTDHDSHSR
jgi:PAS domain S-box-containing protein